MRIAIVSDPLVQRGGAERVVEKIAGIFPDAPVFALLYSARTGPASIASRVIPSFLQRVPGAVAHHRLFAQFFPAAIESFDVSAYDVVISSHHTVAKGVLTSARQRHICYCHTPMRAVWERPFEELRRLPAPARPIAAAAMRRFRVWDASNAANVDTFIANSATTQARIRKYYGRPSTVIYPPIETGRFTGDLLPPSSYYLVASRNVPYKRIDLAVEATRLSGRKLVIAGSRSRAFDAPHVEQIGHVDDAALLQLMRRARALLFPGVEDFGMTPVEMMSCGRPVIAYAQGGALETVIDGVTGILVQRQSAGDFAEAIHRLERTEFDSAEIRAHTVKFSAERFAQELRSIVYQNKQTGALEDRIALPM